MKLSFKERDHLSKLDLKSFWLFPPVFISKKKFKPPIHL